jgi:hypothetical protein
MDPLLNDEDMERISPTPNTKTFEKIPTTISDPLVKVGKNLDKKYNSFSDPGWMEFLMDCAIREILSMKKEPPVWKKAVINKAIEMAKRFNNHSPWDYFSVK